MGTRDVVQGLKAIPTRQSPRREGVRSAGLIASVVLLLSVVSACSGAGSSDKGSSDTLSIAIGTEAVPNPALATTKAAWLAISYSLVYAPLIHQTPDGRLEPALAASWEYIDESGSDPNSVFQLKLRDGAKFADGSTVTPDAVAEWLKYFVAQTGPLAGVLGEDPQFEVVGSDTVTIRMTSPNPSLPAILSDAGGNIAYVVSPKGLADLDSLGANAHGAGPYVLDNANSVRGDQYTYTPNENYYDQDAIKFKQVVVKVIPDASSRLAAQESGQIDVALGDSSTAKPAKDAGLGVVMSPRGVIELVLDVKGGLAPELKDKRVREAINHAIDRKSIAEALLGSADAAASAFLPTDVDTGLNDYWTYDPEKAKSLLADAGHADGFTMKALVQGAYFGQLGEPLMRAVAQDLSKVGINLDITSYATDPEYGKDVFANKAPGFAMTGFVADTPTIYRTYLAPTASANFFGEDEVLAKQFDAGARAEDPTKDWAEMWTRFTTEAYVAPVVVNPTYYYVSDVIDGVEATNIRPVSLPTEWSPK